MTAALVSSNSWKQTLVALSSSLLLGIGCGDAEPGSVTVTVWGEEFIEEAIPAEEFADGWTVHYETFQLVLGQFEVADAHAPGGAIDGTRAFDLVSPGPHTLGQIDGLSAGSFTSVGYQNTTAGAETKRHQSIGKADFADLVDAGYSLYVKGTVTKGDRQKRFAWGFKERVDYTKCVDVRGGQAIDGILVHAGATVEHQITIHGDHLFYDDLASKTALRRFDAMADADADEDGEVTLAELDAVDLSELPQSAGTYGVGAFDVNTLGDFVRAATQTIGHFDGEGHCQTSLGG